MAEQGTQQVIAAHLGAAMRPLADAVASPGAFRAFLRRLGWEASDLPPAYAALGAAVEAVETAVTGLGDDPGPVEIAAVFDALAALYEAVGAIDEAPTGVDATAFLAEFVERTFELLVVDHVAEALPGVYSVAAAIGLVEREYTPAAPGRPAFIRNRLRLDTFGDVLADPASLLTRVYGWGTPDLRFGRIARNGFEFLQAVGINGVAITTLDRAGTLAYLGTNPDDPVEFEEADEQICLRIRIFGTFVGDTELEFGFTVAELRASDGGPAGLILEPIVPVDLAAVVTPTNGDLAFPLGSRVTFVLHAGSDLSKRFGLVLKPGDVSVQYPFDSGVTLPPDGFGVSFVYAPDPAHVLLGKAAGSRLEARKATAKLQLGTSDGEFEAVGSIAFDDVAATVRASDLDGFVGSVVGDRDVTIPLKLDVGWSSRSGLRLNGGAGFEVVIDPHLSVGGVRVDEVRAAVAAAIGTDAAPGIEARATVAVSGELGPVAFALAGIGMTAKLRFEQGNAGPMDVDAGFAPPAGVGLSIDAGGIVSGGGFLRREPDGSAYSGTFALRIAEVEVTAVGVLTTRLPDGSRGYSLVISISSQFTPIQLGYGLTLRGVGGLIAIHRTVDVQAVRTALTAGTVGAVMFPSDPVRDANKIIAALGAMFPIARGRYVFGPMAKLGWGVPVPLVTADVGLFLEVPSPVRLFLLGQLTSLLPTPDEALVEIHIDVLGVLDFSRGELAIDAALRNSRVTTFPMTGEMALRARWRDDPMFAVALGGLHPNFPAPAGFPVLKRLQIALGKGDNPRLDLQAYLAVTSNTVQIGAALELYAKAGGFSVTGHLGFDALFHLVPFSFEAEAKAKVALQRGSKTLASISLELVLSGPQPWRAKGSGSLSLLFFSISFSFDVSWGGAGPLGLPLVDPWPLLQAALADARSWAAVLALGGDNGVKLLGPSTGSGTDSDTDAPVRLPPGARLELRQKVLPLDHRITRFGGGAPAGPDTYRITRLALNGGTITDASGVDDYFAPAQFEDLTDAEALSRPSFEHMSAGLRTGGTVESDAAVVSELTYETVRLDVDRPPARCRGDVLDGVLADTFLSFSATATAPARMRGRGQFHDRATAPALAIGQEGYVIAGAADLTARPDLLPGPASAADAHAALAARIREHPEERDKLQVVLAAEAA